MESKFKKLPGSVISLEASLNADEFKPYWDAAYERAVSRVELKGFRPGMAPKEIAEQAVNKEAVFETALEDAVRHSLNSITQENEWTVIDTPKVEVVSADGLPADPKGALKFKADVVVFPEINLPDYKKIARKVSADKKEVSVTDEEVEKSLDWLRKSRAKEIRVARPAKTGDAVEVEIKTSVGGAPLSGGEIKHDKFALGDGRFIPGFEANLENRKEGEEIKFSLTAPADYWKKELQGKQLDFEVKLGGVYERELPPADDTFAKSLGKFETIADLKKSMGEGLKTEKESKEAEKRRIKILDEVVAGSKIDMPQVFVDKTLDGLVAELQKTFEAAGKKPEEARGELRNTAEKRVAANLAIHEIAKRESLEPSKEEVEEESKYHAGEAKGEDVSRFYDHIYGILLNRKVFQFLENVK